LYFNFNLLSYIFYFMVSYSTLEKALLASSCLGLLLLTYNLLGVVNIALCLISFAGVAVCLIKRWQHVRHYGTSAYT